MRWNVRTPGVLRRKTLRVGEKQSWPVERREFPPRNSLRPTGFAETPGSLAVTNSAEGSNPETFSLMPGQPRQRLCSGDEKFSPPKKATYPGQEVLLLRPARWGASLCYEHRVAGVQVENG